MLRGRPPCSRVLVTSQARSLRLGQPAVTPDTAQCPWWPVSPWLGPSAGRFLEQYRPEAAPSGASAFSVALGLSVPWWGATVKRAAPLLQVPGAVFWRLPAGRQSSPTQGVSAMDGPGTRSVLSWALRRQPHVSPRCGSPILVLDSQPSWPPGCSFRLATTRSSGMGMAGPPCTRRPTGVWRMPAACWRSTVGAWTR